MTWPEICQSYPNQWLIIEALEAHTTPQQLRQLDRIAVMERCQDGKEAFDQYHRLHQHYPRREFYFVHTSREELEIRERQWLGVRLGNVVTTFT
jgi:aspartate/methionine/tyrosine aminotransferase